MYIVICDKTSKNKGLPLFLFLKTVACSILQPVRDIRTSHKKIMSTVTPLANEVTIFQHENSDTVKKTQVNPRWILNPNRQSQTELMILQGLLKSWSSRRFKDHKNSTNAAAIAAASEEGRMRSQATTKRIQRRRNAKKLCDSHDS